MKKEPLRVLCASLLIASFCAACTESSSFALSESVIEQEKPAVLVFPSAINVPSEGGSYTVTLSANCSWAATADTPSCHLSPTSGSTSEHTLILEIAPNTGETPLNGKITVKATNPSGSVETIITITQKNQPPVPGPEYGIKTLNNLLEFAQAVNANESLDPWTDPSDGVIKLLADIDMKGIIGWKPIGFQTSSTPTAFTGIFDGNGFKILNCVISQSPTDTSWGFGLFGYNSGTIRNVVIESGNISSTGSYLAALCARNAGSIENCSVNATVTSNSGASYIGGIVGYNQATIKTCNTTGGNINGKKSAGGIAGYNYKGTISDCQNRAQVTADEDAGGITTVTSGGINNCVNYGAISSSTNKAANGIATYVDFKATVSSCTNHGAISGSGYYNAGVVGANWGTVTDCVNGGTVTGTGWYSGGVVGQNNGVISGTATRNYGAVSGNCEYVGGIAAYNSSSSMIYDAKNEGAIHSECDAPDFYVGGITGWASESSTSIIERCENSGTISGTVQYVGGIVGAGGVPIKDCVNKGKISSGFYTGGIIGRTTSIIEISGCRNEGEISSPSTTNFAGGIAGYTTSAKYISCSNTGKITSLGTNAGGITGYGQCSFEDCSNNGTVTCQKDAVGGITGRLISGSMKNCSNLGDIVGGGTLGYAGGLGGIRTSNSTITGSINNGSVNGIRPGPEFGGIN